MEQTIVRRVFAKILLVLVVVVGLIVGGGWALLYGNFLANNESILRLRNRYFYLLGQRAAIGTLLYGVRPTSVAEEGGERVYTYKLMGRVVEVDYIEQIMMIQDMWGKRWSGHFVVTPDEFDKNLAKLRINQNTYLSDGSMTNKIAYIDIDTTAPGATKGFQIDDVVIWLWRDKRRVGEIEGVIELREDTVTPITYLNWWRGEK